MIAEPVGSCTDLVATVIRPLQQVYSVPFDIAPYGVIIKPSHGLKILQGTRKGGFSPQAEYIFRKQIEEADFVIINRIDELSEGLVTELTTLIENQFPGTPCLKMSATSGEGFASFCEYLDLQGVFGTKAMEVDYDVYAEGEAELGWLNAQVVLTSERPFELDTFLLKLLERVNADLSQHSAEVAHLKAIGMTEGKFAVANIVSSASAPKLSIGSSAAVCTADLVINARVAVDPELLTKTIQKTLQSVCQEFGVTESTRTLQCFRPGRPVPTHRLENSQT